MSSRLDPTPKAASGDAPAPENRLRYLGEALVFGLCYLVLDWASYLHPLGPFNITLWNPPPALCIAWILLGGMRYAPAVLITVTLSDMLIRQAPGGWVLSLATSFSVAAIYVAIAAVLRLWAIPQGRITEIRQLARFCLIATAGAALASLVYVGLLKVAGYAAGNSFADALLHFWLGDLVGILVTAPLLLVAADSEARRRFLSQCRHPETAIQFLVMTAATWVVFLVIDGDPSKYFYLLFLPLIWIAVRRGLAGAVLASAIVQSGVVFLAHADEALHSLAVAELQALVAALSITGMFLGLLLDERERVEHELKESLRLAAAGEMAGAIAHEINQPLGAMMNYGRACELLIERHGIGTSAPELADALRRLLGEARRASEVVARLREFFRGGTTHLAPMSLAALLDSARTLGENLNRTGTEFHVAAWRGGEQLYADRLQLELVLRNLLANAFEATAATGLTTRSVSVSAALDAEGNARITVTDSGHGVAPSLRERLFTPFSTGKSMGMGLGLAISRAIAEAHGGTLHSVGTSGGEFQLLLPLHPGASASIKNTAS